MQFNLTSLRHIALKIAKRWFLLGGVAFWLFLLGLSLMQARNEGVIFSTPYGYYYLRILIIPISGLILFFIIALFRPDNSAESPLGKMVFLQGFLLFLIFLMLYWASKTLLLANWLVLIGVLLILPLLYGGGVGIVGQNTLLGLGGIIVTLIVFELFMHMVPQIWPPVARHKRSNWGRIHADIPFHVQETPKITYKANELGFRSPSPVPDEVDLVALGDSFTYGIGAAHPWPERVAEKLNWQVLNLGINGSSPPSQIPPLTEYGLPRHPRVVIQAYFEGNDVYPCDQPARSQGARWGDNLISPDLLKTIDLKISNWFLPPAITSAINYDVVTPSEVMFNGQLIEVTFAPAYIATLTLDKARLKSSENWRIVSQNLLQMRNLVNAENSIFMLVYVPERTRVYWPLIRENEDVINRMYQDHVYQWVSYDNCLTLSRSTPNIGAMAFRDKFDETVDEQQQLVATFAAENDILFLDLTEPLRAQAAQGVVLAHPLETHYNDEGNEIIASAIAAYIKTISGEPR